MKFNSKLWILVGVIASFLSFNHMIEAQQIARNSNGNIGHQPTSPDELGERVDKLISAAGDLYLKSQPQTSTVRLEYDPIAALIESIGDQSELGGANYVALRGSDIPTLLGGVDGPAQSRNYHSLVDDFRQSYLSSNPLREVRAFKPKLMSTARGFGKRAYKVSVPRNYADLLSSASQSRPFFLDGKLLSGGSSR